MKQHSRPTNMLRFVSRGSLYSREKILQQAWESIDIDDDGKPSNLHVEWKDVPITEET